MCIKHILRRNNLCFDNLQKLPLTFTLLFNYISSSFLHLFSMMPLNVIADHSSEELLLHMLTLFTTPPQDGQHHPSTLWVSRRCQHSSCHCHWSSSHSASSLVFLYDNQTIFLFLNLPLHWSFSVAVTTSSTS